MFKFYRILFDEKGDGDGGGGTGFEKPPEGQDPPKDQKDDPASKKEGDIEYDELGYAKDKKPDDKEKGKNDKKTDDGKKEDNKEVDPKEDPSGTGYEVEPKDDKKPDDKKPDDKKPDDDPYKDLDVKGLAEKDSAKVMEFAKKNSLSKEAAQALVDMKKAEFKEAKDAADAFQKQMNDERVRIKKEWYQELKNDPNFGGDKFDFNVKQVGKLMSDFMPETKKILTKKGTMLPPYVMKDFAKLAGKLYESENLVHGGGGGSGDNKNEKVDDKNSHLDFYNQKTE